MAEGIGKNIKRLLEERNLRQIDLAEKKRIINTGIEERCVAYLYISIKEEK